MNADWWVYILECRDGSLYTGIAVDVEQRVLKHNAGRGAKYTAARLPVQLVYSERSENRSEASKREWEIKQLTRKGKLDLIEVTAE